ncbi:MAG: hypothetical protein ACKVP0_06595 [Pirellulaceae bacterium]
MTPLARCANRPGYRWLRLLALALLVFQSLGPLAGCAALNLLEGKLPSEDEDDLGIVTRPYPGWENKAKETLDKIPSAGEKQQTAPAATASPTATPPANSSVPAATNVNTNVTTEQPAAPNPAAATSTPSLPASATSLTTSPNQPSSAKLVEALPRLAAAAPALGHPTHNNPLAVAGAEANPVQPTAAVGDKKVEPTAAERLATLIKQRSEFLSALKAEVNRRRGSTSDDEELTRLEKELRLVQLAGEQPEEAVRQIDALDGPERDAFAHLLMGLATWMNADEARRPTLRNAKIVREIRDAAAELASASKLDVRNLAFCEKVESYGWYTEFSRSQFKPKQQVILYAEVENFSALRIADDSYETELQGSYQIFDSRGNLVDERELPLDKEVCRNYRRDYFLAYLIYLPDGISTGNYRLELTIEDKKGSALQQESKSQRGEKEDKLAVKSPSSASSYKGRKLGTGTIEFTVK